MSGPAAITIGRLSADSGVNIETIRYYERIGLIPAPPRSSGGRRIYGADDARRLSFIRRARDLGFSLDAVRSLLGLNAGPLSCAAVYALTARHLEAVREKIAALRRLEATLAEAAAACEKSADPACPIIDALLEK